MKSPANYLFIAPLTDLSMNLTRIVESTLAAFDLKPSEELGNYLVPEANFSEDQMLETLPRYIEDSDFIIADISGSNSSVMYGIGLAHGLRKMVLPIVRRDEPRIPEILGRINYLVYDPEHPESLSRYLKNWAVHYLPVKA